MGLRFRKSINLGGGFKINLSKSGIGYSWGVKGFRVTKTAKGINRRTTSIPGTGISHVSENKKKSNSVSTPTINNKHQTTQIIEDANTYETHEIKNAIATEIVSEGLEDMLASATTALKLRKIATITFWITLILGFYNPLFLILTVVSAIAFFIINKKGIIDLSYTFEDDQETIATERITPLLKISNSQKIWYLTQTSKVIDKKYSAGASDLVKRKSCSTSSKLPFPFKTNAEVIVFTLGSEKLLFLPDKLFVIQGTKIGALNYTDVNISINACHFIEDESVPHDAHIVDHTWKYVNKQGGPDKRFSDNKKLPICLYGKMIIKSSSGLDTVIIFSKFDNNDI